MGSTRLPGKVIKPFFHTTLLGWILERLINQPWRVIVATTKNHKDNKIEEFCLKKNGQYFRGDEQDVLDRFYRCAVKYKLAHIVRLTADNPFPDTDIIKRLVKLHLSKSADYTHSFGELPIGVGSEIFSFESLEYSWKHGNKKKYREHCNDFILDNPEKFKIESLTERELETLKLITQEYSTTEIAEKLNVGVRTVDTYRQGLLTKLKVKNSVGLAMYAVKNNII